MLPESASCRRSVAAWAYMKSHGVLKRRCPMNEVPQPTGSHFLKISGWALIALFILHCPDRHAAGANPLSSQKPNVIIILADDLGWAELGCYGNQFNETPHIDRLAHRGMRFTDAYAPAPVCSPTRAALLTGQYPARIGILDYLRPDADNALSPDTTTFAEILKSAGYATGMIGKWHLSGYAHHGSSNEIRARDHGFDEERVSEIKGVGNGANFYPYVFRDQKISWLNVDRKRLPGNEYLVDRMNVEAIDFIERHSDGPFLLYLSHFATHSILHGKPSLVRKYLKKHKPGESSRDKCYLCLDIGCDGDPGHHWAKDHNPHLAAMLESIDDGVGMITKKLDELGLTDETLIVFTSDNGGESNVTRNGPLRAGKSSLYEGGIRVPMVVCWPATVNTGQVCAEPVNIVDLYPTLLEAAGIAPNRRATLDGVSWVPLFRNPLSKLARGPMYWHYPLKKPHFLGGRSSGAIRKGPWKLIEFFETGEVVLYNLTEDIGERNDQAESYPQKTQALLRMLRDWRKTLETDRTAKEKEP